MYYDWIGDEVVNPPQEEPLFKAKCIVGALFVRSCPSSSCKDVGALTEGQIVDVYEVSANNWFRVGLDQWCSGSPSYMEKIEMPEPSVEERLLYLEAKSVELDQRVSDIEEELENINSKIQ